MYARSVQLTHTHAPDVDSFLLPVNFCQSTTLLSFLKLITFFCCHYFLLRNFWYNLFEIIFTHFFPQFFLPKFLKTMKKMIVLNLKRHILIRYFVIKMDHKIFTFFCFVLLTRNSNNYNKLFSGIDSSILKLLPDQSQTIYPLLPLRSKTIYISNISTLHYIVFSFSLYTHTHTRYMKVLQSIKYKTRSTNFEIV